MRSRCVPLADRGLSGMVLDRNSLIRPDRPAELSQHLCMDKIRPVHAHALASYPPPCRTGTYRLFDRPLAASLLARIVFLPARV